MLPKLLFVVAWTGACLTVYTMIVVLLGGTPWKDE
jgi:hypothetical protein